MAHSCLEELPLVGCGDSGADMHPYRVHNRRPTPQDLLELSRRIYKSSSRLYSEADSQGMRVYHDELLVGDVRLVMLVPSFFPKAHVAFDWARVQGSRVSVVFVLRGTMQDLVGNTKANLQLIYNKLVDDQHLPDTATDATKVIQAWLLTLLRRHPQLNAGAAADGSGSSSGSTLQQQQQGQQQQQQLHLDIHITGHSLGGLLSEVASVESAAFAARYGAEWSCTSWESPGMPDLYYNAALRIAPKEHWDGVITSYLAAPSVINMLYRHLGRVMHVVVPWEHTWTFMAKCVGADVARVTAWAILGSMLIAGAGQVAGIARRRTEEEVMDRAATAAAAQLHPLQAPQCPAFPQLRASASAPASLGAEGGPAVPQFLLVAATPSSAADTAAAAATAAAAGGGRRLLSIAPLPPPAAAAAGNAAAAAAASAAAAQQQAATMVGTAVAAAAAAGEAAASMGGARILHGMLRRSGLGTLAGLLGGWVFGRGGVWGVMECLAGVLGVEVEELLCQHALGPMRQCFDPHTGELKARYCRTMASWPHLGTRGKVILTAAKQVAKWTMPSFVCRDNLGVANIISRTAMVEARCSRLQGYEVLEDTEEARQALGLTAAADTAAADGFAAPSDMYMPLVEEPDSPCAAGATAAAVGQLEQQQEQQLEQQQHRLFVQALPPRQRQFVAAAALPAPRGLGGVGLNRHAHGGTSSTAHQQQQQTLGVVQDALGEADALTAAVSAPLPPAPAAADTAGAAAAAMAWDGVDEAAAMAVDAVDAAAEGFMLFEDDAVQVGPEDMSLADDDVMLPSPAAVAVGGRGIGAGSLMQGMDAAAAEEVMDVEAAGAGLSGGSFIQLRGVGAASAGGGLGGAFEPVSLPHLGGAGAGGGVVVDEEERELTGQMSHMQLQFNH